MNLKVAGKGVYLMTGWENISLAPVDALPALPWLDGLTLDQEKVLCVFITIHGQRQTWCGFEVSKFMKSLRKAYPINRHFMAVDQAFDQLVEGGLMEIRKRFKARPFRWLNPFFPQVVFVTGHLIRLLEDNVALTAARARVTQGVEQLQ